MIGLICSGGKFNFLNSSCNVFPGTRCCDLKPHRTYFQKTVRVSACMAARYSSVLLGPGSRSFTILHFASSSGEDCSFACAGRRLSSTSSRAPSKTASNFRSSAVDKLRNWATITYPWVLVPIREQSRCQPQTRLHRIPHQLILQMPLPITQVAPSSRNNMPRPIPQRPLIPPQNRIDRIL